MKYFNQIVSVLLLLTVLVACQEMPEKSAENSETEEVMDSISYPVRVQTIEQTTVHQTAEYTGTLVPNKEVYYAPASPGRIEKIFVEVGDRVKKGQVLLEMDKTQLSQALTQLASAQDAFDRIAKLNETGSIAEQQFEQAKTQLELARLNVDLLRKNLNFTSPVSGLVTSKYYENGELYSGAPNTQIGKAAVVVIQQINPIKVIVNLTQSILPEVKNGMKGEFVSDIYPDKTYSGQLSKIYPSVDPMTRTFKTEFLINNRQGILKPGMSVDMVLPLDKSKGILLPSIAVLNQSGTNNRFIFLNEGGKAKRLDVEIVNRYNDKVEISTTETLVGKQLIIEGQSKLKDGVDIEIADN